MLTGVSVWFLGAVALAGLGPAALTFNFHFPAAFVRLFALSKTLTKFGERVVGHRAALLDQVRRRSDLLLAMAHAPSTRAAAWQLGHQDRLSDYVDDVEDVDYARLRVGMPALVLVIGMAALTLATAWLTPVALLPIAAVSGVIMITLRLVLPRLKQRSANMRNAQRSAGRQIDATLAAVVPLQAERNFTPCLKQAFAQFDAAESERLAQRHTFAWLDMLAGLIGPIATLSVLAAAWHSGNRDSALLIAAFLAFGWLAFGETAQGISRIVLGHVREIAAREGLKGWIGPADGEVAAPAAAQAIQNLNLDNVPRQAPDGRRLGEALNVSLQAGRPTMLVGASGTGKTTLLKQIAGWLGDDTDGHYTGDNVVLPGLRRRALSHLCLHDAAILSDTVRENLFAPDASEAECWQALTAMEIDERITAAGGLDAWISQDMLSLGEAQRLNLARTWLSSAPLVFLDEPGEHLDAVQASRILDRLLSRMKKRIVIYSSHEAGAATGAVQISLGA